MVDSKNKTVRNMKNIIHIFLVVAAISVACENQDWEFPDYDYQTVYFANQFPVRTITLGEDIYDTSLDNEWKCKIMATTGGVYEARKNVTIDIEVDNAMCEGFTFDNGNPLMAMPEDYYTLSSNQITIPSGQLTGGVEVQLTEAFFADPLAISNTYVIPVRMTNVQNADSILSGKTVSDAARRGVLGDWSIAPKDYVFYAIKYINPWHGNYLRRGVDNITGELNTKVVRHKQYVEDDEVKMLSTRSLNHLEFPLVFKDASNNNIECTLLLSFDENGNCSISSEDFTATGSGKFIKKGEKKSWGDQDRDALYLTYQIDLGTMQVSTTDTLVMRNRGVSMELFNPVLE
jgi:Family of unknown function (DUF5627)/Domain of unknown function (DUF1735)